MLASPVCIYARAQGEEGEAVDDFGQASEPVECVQAAGVVLDLPVSLFEIESLNEILSLDTCVACWKASWPSQQPGSPCCLIQADKTHKPFACIMGIETPELREE